MNKVGFISFDRDRQDRTGSARIRVFNLLKYAEDFEVFVTGVKYDAVIFQKYYWHDYATIYPGVKILDICDPDWLQGSSTLDFVRMVSLMDGIVCNTEATLNFVKKITDKPVIVIPDRHDMKEMTQKKVHKGRAKSAVWFGYSHNAHVLRPYVMKLQEHDLRLTIISEKFVTVADKTNSEFKDQETFVKWPDSIEKVNLELLRHDFCLLPIRRRIAEQYKSNNKDTHAWSIGLPVAHWGDEVDTFIEEESRTNDQKAHYEQTRRDYDVKKSVDEYREFIGYLAKRTKKNV